jgi:transmembrane sensor
MSTANHEIDRHAAEWAVKRDLGVLTPEQQAAFDAWLAADIRHLGAYGRAEAVLGRLERFHSGAVGQLRACQPPAPPMLARRRVILTGGIAASLAAIGFFGATYWQSGREEIFATGLGQVREVPLADGSLVVLNTNSRVAVRFSEDKREIHLLQGEALFDVAKNKKRPFIVTAGNMQVRAVGTAFTVSMLPQRPIQVLVKEGVVELNRSGAAKGPPVRVKAYTQALAPNDAPIMAAGVAQSKLDRTMAWQFGRLDFDNETLQDAVGEFARYSDVRIVVDPAVANRTVTGLFVSNDPIGFAKAAATALKLNVQVGEREVRLSGRTDGAP